MTCKALLEDLTRCPNERQRSGGMFGSSISYYCKEHNKEANSAVFAGLQLGRSIAWEDLKSKTSRDEIKRLENANPSPSN